MAKFLHIVLTKQWLQVAYMCLPNSKFFALFPLVSARMYNTSMKWSIIGVDVVIARLEILLNVPKSVWLS